MPTRDHKHHDCHNPPNHDFAGQDVYIYVSVIAMHDNHHDNHQHAYQNNIFAIPNHDHRRNDLRLWCGLDFAEWLYLDSCRRSTELPQVLADLAAQCFARPSHNL